MKKTANNIDLEETEDILSDSLYFNQNNRTFYLHGDITTKVGTIFCKAIDSLDYTDETPIIININSSGGSYDTGVTIINSIISCPLEFYTWITGSAYSAAGFIFLAGDKRIMSDISSLMFHYPSLKIDDALNKIKESAIINEEIFFRLLDILLENTKIDKKTFLKNIENADWYLSPKEAKRIGFLNAQKISR